MPANPFAPPKVKLSDQPKPAMAPWKAVLLGFSIDFGGSILTGILFAGIYAVFLASAGMSAGQIRAEISDTPPTSRFFIIGTLAGTVFSFLGGLVCTRAARRSNYSLGLVLAALSVSSSFLPIFLQHSIALTLPLAALTIASVLLGTKFGLVKSEARHDE